MLDITDSSQEKEDSKRTLTLVHASDLHGNWQPLVDHDCSSADLFLFTGDTLPNFRCPREHEGFYQTEWLKNNKAVNAFLSKVNGRPIFFVDGNHDFMKLSSVLPNSTELTTKSLTCYLGFTFAGFPEVPWIDGYWNHECSQEKLAAHTKKILNLGTFDVLATHAPPSGILSHIPDWGNRELRDMVLSSSKSSPLPFRYNFFGHIHECGGMQEVIDGVVFVNGSCTVQTHVITRQQPRT